MLTLYLACLVFGGILLAVSVFAGLDHDGGLDHGFDHGVDAHVGAHAGISGHGDHSFLHDGLHDVGQFLSFRSLVFFAAFFGLTGTLLSLAGTHPLATLPASAVMGLLAAAAMHKTLGYLRATESGAPISLANLEGSKATIVVAPTRQMRGKVRVAGGEQFVQLLALVAEEAKLDEFRPGETVTIVRIDGDVAHVAEESFIR
jgi:membrane protein implicated in regulation of membrane protease activity